MNQVSGKGTYVLLATALDEVPNMLISDLNSKHDELLERLKVREEDRVDFFVRLRPELKRLANLRMDARLGRRVDASDVVQEAFVMYMNGIEAYLESPNWPPEIWIRNLVRNTISELRRKHIEAQCRNIRRECNFNAPIDIEALAVSFSSVGNKAVDNELHQILHDVFSKMPELDREVLAMVHLEGKTLEQVAIELDLKFETTRKRYRRAIDRLIASADSTKLKDFKQDVDSK